MKVSNTISGRFCVLLNEEEQKLIPAPYRIEAVQGTKRFKLIGDVPGGSLGSTRDKYTHAVEIASKTLPPMEPFGVCEVNWMRTDDPYTVTFSLPDRLPMAQKGSNSPRRRDAAPEQPAVPDIPLKQLVRMINEHKAAAGVELILEVKPDGFLRALVEYE